MSGGFQIEEHTADLGVKVWAKTVPGLFEEAARAMIALMIEGSCEAEPEHRKKIRLEEQSCEALLLLWLREILFLIENENVAYVRFQLGKNNLAERDASTYYFVAELGGVLFTRLRHEVCREIKAVTRHGFYLKKNGPWWEARVLFDV